MKLSIVTTLYNSSKYISEFYSRISASAKQYTEDYEIIFVDDGSPDNSLSIAVEVANIDSRVKVLELSRNFGHHKAMMTGLSHATGDLVFLIDADLEEEPELLNSFYQYHNNNDVDVVYGTQEVRKGGKFEQISGALFYKTLNYLSDLKLQDNIITARLMTSEYVKALVSHDEREVFIAGLWQITGFKQDSITVKKHSTSETTYSIRHKLAILVNSVTSFSNKPLRSIFHIGVFISLSSFLYISYILINKLFFASPIDGWTSIMASIWLLGGMIISFIGIIGIYLSKIYSETKKRPYTIIRKIYER